MTTTINGMIVSGTPEEICELIKLQAKPITFTDKTMKINEPDVIPSHTRPNYDPWLVNPHYDPWLVNPYYNTGDGIDYLKYQPNCTSSAQSAKDVTAVNNSTTEKSNNFVHKYMTGESR